MLKQPLTDLRNTLKDLLLTLCKKPHEFSMVRFLSSSVQDPRSPRSNQDFDPHRQTAADDAASRNLEQVTEAFLVCISQSIDQVPATIREICSHIGEVVGDRFPESIFTACARSIPDLHTKLIPKLFLVSVDSSSSGSSTRPSSRPRTSTSTSPPTTAT